MVKCFALKNPQSKVRGLVFHSQEGRGGRHSILFLLSQHSTPSPHAQGRTGGEIETQTANIYISQCFNLPVVWKKCLMARGRNHFFSHLQISYLKDPPFPLPGPPPKFCAGSSSDLTEKKSQTAVGMAWGGLRPDPAGPCSVPRFLLDPKVNGVRAGCTRARNTEVQDSSA